MATLRPHPTHPGWYHLDAYINGKRERITFESLQEAEEYKNSIEGKAPRKHAFPTLSLIEPTYTAWMKDNYKRQTYVKRCYSMKRILETFGQYRVADINQLMIDKWVAGRSRHTASNDVQALTAMLTWMVDRELAEKVPKIKFKRAQYKIKPVPTPADVLQAIEGVKVEQVRVMLQLMTYCGLRWQETRLLRWEDIRGNQIRIDSPKTSEAIVAIPTTLQSWFEANRKREGYVFIGNMHQPYRKLDHVYAKLYEATGIKLSNHLLRHAGAVWLQNQTGNTQLVSNWLRHSNLSTTATYLRKYDTDTLRNSSDTLVNLVNSGQ